MNDLNVSASASGLAVRFLDVGGCVRSGEDITREAVDQLLHLIQAGRKLSAYLPLDEYGEDGGTFLTVDIDNGWAALAFHTWDEAGEAHMDQPAAKGCDSAEEAPVYIGGQTPVRKRNALQDRELAAACVLHFAKTGERYPGLEWEAWEPGV